MRARAGLTQVVAVAALVSLFGGTPALAGTFVYVSNAEDGDIATYAMRPDGALTVGGRVAAAKIVMPMAVSPDRRFLYAGVRSKPFSVHVYSIDDGTEHLRGGIDVRVGVERGEALSHDRGAQRIDDTSPNSRQSLRQESPPSSLR